MLSKKELIDKIRKVKPVLESDYAVKSIGLFGSYSEGCQTEESDVDLLVEFSQPVGWNFFSLEAYLETLLNAKIDLVTSNALKKQLRSSILSQVEYL